MRYSRTQTGSREPLLIGAELRPHLAHDLFETRQFPFDDVPDFVQIQEADLQRYIEAAQDVRSKLQAREDSQAETARQRFKEAVREARHELVGLRLQGESTNATFTKTILDLLRRKGPMTTNEMHPHIQRIHPNLCDDSIDRVVAGENYRKRWKHRVRSAQSTLKKRGAIELENGKWHSH